MSDGPRVARIAHGYGNHLPSLDLALAADIDVIEADVWLQGKRIVVRHERRADPLPLLYDSVSPYHPPGPWAVRLGRWVLRLDLHPLPLRPLLSRTAGKKHVMIDVKGKHDERSARRFARTLINEVRAAGAAEWVSVCGQAHIVLDALRGLEAPFPVRYSMERPDQWQAFLEVMRADENVRAISIHHKVLNHERLAVAKEHGVDIYCWTIGSPALAERLVSQGVDGIISNDLDLLTSLPR